MRELDRGRGEEREEKKSEERRGWGKKRRKGKCGKNGIWEEGKKEKRRKKGK